MWRSFFGTLWITSVVAIIYLYLVNSMGFNPDNIARGIGVALVVVPVLYWIISITHETSNWQRIWCLMGITIGLSLMPEVSRWVSVPLLGITSYALAVKASRDAPFMQSFPCLLLASVGIHFMATRWMYILQASADEDFIPVGVTMSGVALVTVLLIPLAKWLEPQYLARFSVP